ncbi:hypothetical protein V7S43_012330 [Phytophthora oleae]|uniref:Lebercilin domain-containing protein n=1 Tax=Phytophthora oleae TaxID=2107226 RepID=A0ABD3F6J0_9STRA
MRSHDSPHVEVVLDSPERHESIPSGSGSGSIGNNGGSLHSGLAEAKHLKERLNTAQVKVKKLQRLEAALVDFFMEVMDRSENNGTERLVESESSFVRGKRKEQFLKKAEGDPISLLNMLRTHLRLQFAKQETQHVAAKRRALAENLSSLQKDQDTRDKFQQLEFTCEQLKEQLKSLMDQLNEYEVDQARTRRQHQMSLEKMNAHVQEERSRGQEAQLLVSKQQQEIETLKEAQEVLLKAAQNQKSLDGTRTPGTATAGAGDGTSTAAHPPASGAGAPHSNGDFFGTPAENQTLRRALRKYEVKMAQTEAASEERKREVQRLQQQLTGLRQSTQLQMYSRLEKESHNLRELSDDLKRRLSESEADLLRTKGTLKERDIQVQKMRAEYTRLFNAVQKQKQSAHYSPPKLARTASAAQLSASQQSHSAHQPQKLPGAGFIEAGDIGATAAPANGEHPYVVAYYRSEAARVERESEALKLQIRRMMASEQLHKQKTRVLRAEKENLTRERDQLRADLDRAKKHSTMQSIAMSRQQTHSSTDKPARKVGFTAAQQEVKHLKERNVFLEERYRKSLQSNSTLATIGAVARLRSSVSVPPGFDLDVAGPGESPELESDSETIGTDCNEDVIPSHNSAILAKPRPFSAQTTTIHKDSGGSFRSLDGATLHSLQQVRRTTRVRPKSANPVK